MGLLDALRGIKRPEDGVAPQDPAAVHAAILAVNRPTAPFVVHDADREGVDLVAEWKIVDAQWYGIFLKAGLKDVYQVLMRLQPEDRIVRAVEEELQVSWDAGAPGIRVKAGTERRRSKQLKWAKAVAFTEELRPGVVYEYRFATDEIKEPLQEAVLACGWTWQSALTL